MTTRVRLTAAQKRMVTALIVRYEDELLDHLEALRKSVTAFGAEFEHQPDVAAEAERAWVNYILRFVLETSDAHRQPDSTAQRGGSQRLVTRAGTWEKVSGLPITVYELVDPAQRPG